MIRSAISAPMAAGVTAAVKSNQHRRGVAGLRRLRICL